MTAEAAVSGRPSFERVEAALSERDLITGRRGGTHLDARCPAHEDAEASLSVDWKPGTASRSAGTFLRCHTGCSQDAVREALGLGPRELFDGPSPGFANRPLNGARPRPAARNPLPASGRPRTVPKPRSGDPGAGHEHRAADWRRPESDHVYHRLDTGERLALVRRWRCADPQCPGIEAKGKPGRKLATYHVGDGGKWAKGKPPGALGELLDGTLYRAREVAAAIAAGQPVMICGGEGDADAAAAAGICGTSNYGGETRPVHPAHVEALRGAHVIVGAHRDETGYRKAAAWAAELASVARSVRVVRGLVDKWPGADLSDHLAAGHSLGELADCDPAAELARLAEPPEPEPEPEPEQGNVTPIARIGRVHPRPVEGSPGWQFTPPDNDGAPGAVERLMGSGEDRGMVPVIQSCPRVTERLVTALDSTTRDRRHYTIRWGEDEATVSYADLISGDAWGKFPDALGTGDKPVRAALANVVMTQGAELARTLAATRTGWHDDPDGARYYLHPDGRTFPPGRHVRLIGAPPRLVEAARPRGTATDEQLRQALADIREHGRFAGLLGVAGGARSLGQSIRSVPAALAVHGESGSGKSMLGWHGRSMVVTSKGARVEGWPPLPTKSFTATKTDLEFAVNFEADIPALIEDLALPANASAIEVREAAGKLEALIRSFANQDEIRGRRSRDLLPGPSNFVRSIPMITAERMPPTMMESLYRRAVVPCIRRGQIDTAWYAANSPGLLTPLRTIGDRIIARLFEHGDDAGAKLGAAGAAAYGVLGVAIGNAAWLTDSPVMTGVVDGAAAILGGLYLVADVVPGIDGAELAEPVAAYLAEALAEQASVMSDRHDDSGSLAEAVAHVLTRSLASRRAHVCDAAGSPAPLIPGMAASEQGLIEAGGFGASYRGDGVALYWLPERGGIGIRSKALAALLAESRDPRAAGLTYRSLPAALLRDGASIRNTTQKGRSGTHLVRSVGDWLIVLRPEVLTGDGPEVIELSPTRSSEFVDNNDNNDNLAGQRPADDLQAADGEKIDNSAGQAPAAADPPPASDEARSALTSPGIAVIVPTVPAGTSVGARASERFAAPAVVVDVDGAYLARADRLEAVELPQFADLAELDAWARSLRLGVAHAAGMPDDGVAVVMPGLAARFGVQARLPGAGTKAARDHAALGPLRAAGLVVPELRSWMRPWRKGERTVRLWLPGSDDAGECPMWEEGVAAVTLAYRLGLFAEKLGIGWRLTGGITGVDLSATFPRRSLKLEAADPPRPALTGSLGHAFRWSRKPMTDEVKLGWLHCYDGNGAYLAAYNTPVNVGGWRHAESPEFDRNLPGYWLIDPPGWADRFLPDLFDPTGRAAATGQSGPRWYVTPTLALAEELGYELRPREAWLPAGRHGRFYEPWYERVRDARAALMASTDADTRAVLDSLKVVWHATHGQVGTKSQGSRKDHDQAIIAAYAANLMRRLVKVSGVNRWPLAIGTDAIAFAADDPDPASACPAGMVLGDGLGEFKVQGALPMAEAAPLLGTGRPSAVDDLFELASSWLADHEGAPDGT